MTQKVEHFAQEGIVDILAGAGELEEEFTGCDQEFGRRTQEIGHDRHATQPGTQLGERQVAQKDTWSTQESDDRHEDADRQPVDRRGQGHPPIIEEFGGARQDNHGGQGSRQHAGQLAHHAH
jgi:hypothetical protein